MSKKTPADLDQRCPLPFMQFAMMSTGQVCPCCFNQDYVITEAKKHSLDEIWNHPRMQSLRKEFLIGEPKSCESQIRKLGCNKYYDHHKAAIDWKEVQTKPPKRLDIRLNGKCNLECIMCDVWKDPNGYYDESFFWKEGPTQLFPHLKSIMILGGEPFVQRDTFRMIDEIQKVSPDCEWTFFTNGNWKWTKKVQNHMDKIKTLAVNLSLDSVDRDFYEVWRKKGNFKQAIENLKYWEVYRDLRGPAEPLHIFVSFVISKLNWQEIPKMLEFCEEKYLGTSFQYLDTPAELSLTSLPVEERQSICAQISQWSEASKMPQKINWKECMQL